jgi:hypothetical protein
MLIREMNHLRINQCRITVLTALILQNRESKEAIKDLKMTVTEIITEITAVIKDVMTVIREEITAVTITGTTEITEAADIIVKAVITVITGRADTEEIITDVPADSEIITHQAAEDLSKDVRSRRNNINSRDRYLYLRSS